MSAFIVVLMLTIIILCHEAAHTAVATVLGYKMNKLYLGIPLTFKIGTKEYSTAIWKKKKGGVEYGVSWLILGGAVDFDGLESAPWWKMSLIALAGPVSNFLLAFLAICFVAGPFFAWSVTVQFSQVVITGLGLVLSGSFPVSQLSGPVGFVNAMGLVASGYTHGWLMVWCLINTALFVTNIIPIPALDGGQIMTSILGAVFGEKAKKPIKAITYVCLYDFCFLMALVIGRDVWNGVLLLFK